MNIAKRCPARSNQLSAAAKQQPAENNKQRESDDGDDGGDGYTKQNGRTMRKQSEHSDVDPDCDSNGHPLRIHDSKDDNDCHMTSAHGAEVDDNSNDDGKQRRRQVQQQHSSAGTTTKCATTAAHLHSSTHRTAVGM